MCHATPFVRGATGARDDDQTRAELNISPTPAEATRYGSRGETYDNDFGPK